MRVELLSFTPEPEKLIATAGKLCYSAAGIEDLRDGLDDEGIGKYIDMLMSLGHESVLEHVSFTFGIEGISRACSHQLVRHRIASYSQKSQRYVNEGAFEYVIPPEIDAVDEAKEIFVRQMESARESYEELVRILTQAHTEKLSGGGDCDTPQIRSKAAKLANEDARYVLPNACETKIIVTMNIRTLFNFFRHRCCNRAQWEIRAVATEMLRLCRGVAPRVFSKAGPSCFMTGRCPEGKMSCGKISEVREIFSGTLTAKP